MTAPERAVWAAFPEGREVDLRVGTPEADDLGAGPGWGAERTVRAAVLSALLLGATERGGEAALTLIGARITGTLALNGCELRHLLYLKGCWLEGRVGLAGATTQAIGIVDSRVPGIWAPAARIGGRLDLRRTRVEGLDHNALILLHAHIAGGLRLDDAILSAPGRIALSAGGLVMDGSVLADRMRADGEVQFPGAQLAGGLFLRGAHLSTFGADNVTASVIRFTEGFTAEGDVRLRGAQIADLLSFEGADLRAELSAVGTRAAELDLRFAQRPGGAVDLRNVQTSWVHDEERTWPDELRLDGFTYDSLRDEAAAARVGWVRRSPGYASQPYEQLAAHYRRIGHDDEARRVLLAKQRHRRRVRRPMARVWGYVLDATVGYGYRPWLAGVWLAVLVLLGTLVFGAHTPTPAKAGEGPPFNALVYTLDLLIPIGGLGQRTAWYWSGQAEQGLAYGLIALGWMLTTTVLAGVTRALTKS